MATLTATAAAAGVQPKVAVQGVFADHFSYSCNALSNGDVVRLGKIQHGTTVLSVQRAYKANASDVAVTAILGSTTLGSATAASGVAFDTSTNLPYTVSVSDDAAVRYQYVTAALAVTSSTTGGSLSLTLYCTRDT